MSNEPSDKEVNISDYYPESLIETSTKNQLSFRQSHSGKNLYLFKEVEIANEYELKIHMEFEYPYDESLNLRFISNEKKDMLVVKDDFGVMLY